MGRLSIFSWSSGKGSNLSDISRSWTLSRPQSLATQSRQQPAPPDAATSDELTESKGACISDNKHVTDTEPKESCPQLAGPSCRTDDQDTPRSGGLEALTFSSISGYSSRRFGGFKSLFRSRKHRRRRLDFDILKDEADDACEDENRNRLCPASDETGDDPVEHQHGSQNKSPANDETRKVSDATEKSANSGITNTTVCHYPSRRMSMPITVVDQDLAYQNPFDDTWEASNLETNVSNPFMEQKTTESTERSGSGYSGSEDPFSSFPGHVLDLSSSSQGSWCCPTLSGFNGWPTPADRRLATDSFNKLAGELYLDPLGVDPDASQEDKAVDDLFAGHGDRVARRRDRLLGRIRTMRSTMQMKSEPPVPPARSLRRMKTFATLPDRPYLMTSLRGKSLETLTRLGGYGFLTLPGDFAPITLHLPVCFVATINYLRNYATPVQSLFVDPGDHDMATQTYHYFADQVLTAEKERAKIHMTMRSSKMPAFLDDPSLPDVGNRDSQVLSVAFTFRALLAGLPGGIMGSMELYRVLVNICHGRISSQSVQRTGSCLAGLSAEDYAKVRAMSLAMLALTGSMQLNLICGVFGLCSLLLHETERAAELERRQRRSNRRSTSGTDKLSVDRLAATLGPLLTDARGDNPDTYNAIQEEIESQRVVALLIGNWRSVSRQLRIWERRGVEGRVQRAASGES
ncbi:hypothetical protein BDV18DRAFT_164276 [Aspergillus unguis]